MAGVLWDAVWRVERCETPIHHSRAAAAELYFTSCRSSRDFFPGVFAHFPASERSSTSSNKTRTWRMNGARCLLARSALARERAGAPQYTFASKRESKFSPLTLYLLTLLRLVRSTSSRMFINPAGQCCNLYAPFVIAHKFLIKSAIKWHTRGVLLSHTRPV